MTRFFNWLRTKLGIVHVEKELTRIYKTVNRLDNNLSRLENRSRAFKRPMRYDQIERDRKRRKKEARKVADIF